MAVDQTYAVFRFSEFEVSERELRLLRNGQELAVEPKAFRVLLYLLHNAGRLVTKAEILNAAWPDVTVGENSLTRAIALLRKVLEDDNREPRFIATVPIAGYRFICAVETIQPDCGDPTPVLFPHPLTRHRPAISKILTFALTAAAAGVLVTWVGWYLSRPLAPPRITGYIQLTYDGQAKFLAGTDGTRLYFTQGSPRSINQIGVNGGETAPVPLAVRGNKLFLSDVSPDGSTALVSSYDTEPWSLLSTPMLGGSIQHVGDGERGIFSPDGNSILYNTENGEVIIARRDGSEPRKLPDVTSGNAGFSWSPDGRVIRFPKGHGLWEMAADGSGVHRVLPDWPNNVPCCGRWTPDGHFYIFVLFNTSTTGSQIWALDERARLFRRAPSQPVQLTTGATLWLSPVPSADGKTVFATGLIPHAELSRIDPKTGGLQPFLGGISAEYMSFSSDGKSVAYVTFPDGILWIADRDGSHRVKLTEPPDKVNLPRWSPDSKQIAFDGVSPEGRWLTYVVSADGGKPKRLLPEERENNANPWWSPDGTKILFSRGSRATKEGLDLRILDLSSGQVRTIPGSARMWGECWSADGRYIAAQDQDAQSVLHVFDMKEQRWSHLSIDSDGSYLNFSRDGRFIYFLRYGSVQGVFRIRTTGGKVERVADMKEYHLTGQYMASMTLDPTDAPLVLREVGSNDIYALTLEQQ